MSLKQSFKTNRQAFFKFDIIVTSVLLVVLGLFYFFYIRRTTASSEKIGHLETSSISLRLNSYHASQYINGTRFPVSLTREVFSDSLIETKFKGRNVVILLARTACHPCQVRELKNLGKLHEKFSHEANFTSIYLTEEATDKVLAKRELKLLKKVSQISFPMLYTVDSVLSEYVSHKSYPIIFIVDDQKVVSSFIPISEDDTFSHEYMRALTYIFNDRS